MTLLDDDLRVRACNQAPVRRRGEYVVYWMIAARRPRWSFALDRAVDRARELERPLVVLEALRVGYRWASDRIHRFVIDGMRDNARAFAGKDVLYHPYVEPEAGAGKGLLEELARRACVVVTDEFPCFFLPRMVAAAARRLDVRLEAVDSNGLLPLRATERVFTTAFSFRSFLQKELPAHLERFPKRQFSQSGLPAPDALPAAIERRWPRASEALLEGADGALDELPIDHDVRPAPLRGGCEAGQRALRLFVDERLARYAEDRNQVEADATSGLSPYLHFGHVSAHQVLAAVADREDWSPADLDGPAGGKREGWWNTSPEAEAFLDQLVTWRELGYNFCHLRDDADRYESLPDWARATLAEHGEDERPHVYTLRQLERAETYDELWNAAQRQLVREGRIHNYLRMLWGKKILEWSASPRDALAAMIELNDKYAVDGRDPNSYSGICWTLGRYDRPWGPERPIFGTVRYMSSENTARKMRVKGYVARWTRPGLFD